MLASIKLAPQHNQAYYIPTSVSSISAYSYKVKRVRNAYYRLTAMSVQEYIDKHDLSKKVEEVINACVKAKPEEPISFMVRPPAGSERAITSG